MNGVISVLYVDDDPESTDLAIASFDREDGIELETRTTVEGGLAHLDEADVDCVVSDYSIGEYTGIDFLEGVRDAYANLPFILYTGTGSETVASDAISAGVTDYLLKGEESIPGVLATRIRNAVARHRTEERFAESEARYRSLLEDVLDTVHVGILILDADGDVAWINRAVEEFFGVERASVVGEDRGYFVDEVTHRLEDGPRFERIVRTADEENAHVESFECHLLAGEARDERWLEYWSKPIETGYYAGGRVEQYQDVTTIRRRERQLQRQNARLEEFAGVISHDLRSPLNVAIGRLALAREDSDSEHLERIDTALDRTTDIVSDVLTLAKQGETVAELASVDLSTLATTCWTTVQHEGAGLTVEDGLTIRGDENRLHHVLETLFRNAVKHGSTSPHSQARADAGEHGSTSPRSHAHGDAPERDGPNVRVRLGRLADGFYVEDDGPGIPEANSADVFETGYSTATGGTGFGLVIVKRIVEAHGWEIRATAAPGGGARFEITGVEFA